MFASFTRTVARAPALRLTLRFNSTLNQITTGSAVTKHSAGPLTVRYTAEHEWIAQHADGISFIGITKYAADALGDATFVELPEVGDSLSTGDSMGSVESVKSSSEIYSPVNGEVIEANEQLSDTPQLINEDPMGDGWLAKVQTEGKLEDYADLLTEEQYRENLKAEDH